MQGSLSWKSFGCLARQSYSAQIYLLISRTLLVGRVIVPSAVLLDRTIQLDIPPYKQGSLSWKSNSAFSCLARQSYSAQIFLLISRALLVGRVIVPSAVLLDITIQLRYTSLYAGLSQLEEFRLSCQIELFSLDIPPYKQGSLSWKSNSAFSCLARQNYSAQIYLLICWAKSALETLFKPVSKISTVLSSPFFFIGINRHSGCSHA